VHTAHTLQFRGAQAELLFGPFQACTSSLNFFPARAAYEFCQSRPGLVEKCRRFGDVSFGARRVLAQQQASLSDRLTFDDGDLNNRLGKFCRQNDSIGRCFSDHALIVRRAGAGIQEQQKANKGCVLNFDHNVTPGVA
jgi:hypothetical protein